MGARRHDDTVAIGEAGTLQPPSRPVVESTAPAARFAVGGTLGLGGTGIVRAAQQLHLGREVALKTLQSTVDDQADAAALLREARVTGLLEHPNVVPIPDLLTYPPAELSGSQDATA
jgi:serine/threonine protein kinase